VFGRTPLEEMIPAARDAGCGVVMPHKSRINEELATLVHGAGLKLATWVVDDPAELERLATFGLYAVGTNRPGVLLQALADGLLES